MLTRLIKNEYFTEVKILKESLLKLAKDISQTLLFLTTTEIGGK